MGTDQLGLVGNPKRKKLKPIDTMCKCGCDLLHHTGPKTACTYGKGGFFGGCDCKKYRPKKEPPHVDPPHLQPPPGAAILMREDLKKPKPMGWAIKIGSHNFTLYFSQLKTYTPNNGSFMMSSNRPGAKRFSNQQLIMMATARERGQSDRVFDGLRQCGSTTSRPLKKITITRICTGSLDDDNLGSALKFIRDGVAKAFRFNDRDFTIAGEVEGKIPIHYRQEKPGKKKTIGIRLEVELRP